MGKSQKALAYYQILGGVLGIGFMVGMVWGHGALSGGQWTILLIVSLMYAYSIGCGGVLFKNTGLGLKLSLVNQLFQVLHFALGGYAYRFVSGASLSIELNPEHWSTLGFGYALSTFQVNYQLETGSAVIGINLVAFFFFTSSPKNRTDVRRGPLRFLTEKRNTDLVAAYKDF
ncbi:hypothetical protein SAMN05421823_112192 [Catalinimonas alkaloidigena]|uniref:Uncharacterized protein n=1 Tax=Catalinimonas alkaloidigena TaxID=1075417 RepID=A0A1G9SK67_9BACT|nr:hypothetical protein [Catalinimonas alkaloidigena]SDM35809.1 hypothetical protein SAMN05421823_112192 [Catalinimonas alkaloidigena]